MEPHQQRVVEEHAELVTKLMDLHSFICKNPLFKKLTGSEKGLLRLQALYMGNYAEVLYERIQLFKNS